MYTETPYKLPGPSALAIPSHQGPAPQAGPEVKSPREWLLLVIWRQKWVILSVLAVAAIAAAAYLKTATPVYVSTYRLLVQQAGPLLAGSSAGQNSSQNHLYTQKELITSEPVLAIASVNPAIADVEMLRGDKSPVRTLKRVVTVDVDKQNDIISVNAYSDVPADAQTIANTVVDAYKKFQTRPKWNNGDEKIRLLEGKKREVESDLAAKTAQLTAMELKYGMLSRSAEQANLMMRKLQTINDHLIIAQREAIDAESAYQEAQRAFGRAPATNRARLDPADDDGDLGISSPQEQAMLRAEMLQTQTMIQELRQRFGNEHPSLVAQRQRLERLTTSYVALIYRRHLTAKRREAALQQAYDAEQKRVIELSAHGAEYARLQTDVDLLRKVRETYDTSLREVQLGIATNALSIVPVEEATVPIKPALPNPTRTIPIALAVGLMCGLVLACMREWIDDRFRSAGEIKVSLGMPLLAVIPQTTIRRSPSVSGQRILLDPGSDAAEAYRALPTAVQFAAPAGQMKTLMVTSPSSGDGKTTLVSNLAIAMAQGGKRVLVVDADLRKPTQHDIFGCKNNIGLSGVLAGRSSLDNAIQRTSVSGLHILPCGPVPSNPAEILNSREFGETLEQLADRYDCVVLDSPPVGGAATDARVIAASCDATLMVLKAQSAHRRQTEAARDLLTSVGARIIGVVVNDLPRRNPNSYGQTGQQQKRYVPGLTNQEYEILQTRSK